MTLRRLFALVPALAATLVLAPAAPAAVGGPDRAFSGDGRVVTRISGDDHVADMLVHRGRTVVVGQSIGRVGGGTDVALARYTAAGALDRTFSGDGIVTTHLRAFDRAQAVAMQGERILVAGGTDNSATGALILMRYRPNGALDRSFSGDGKVTIPIGSTGEATAVALQGDRILIAGWAKRSDVADIVVARFTASGAPDPTFGTGGQVVIDNGDNDMPAGLVVDDDRIVVGGFTVVGGGADLFALRLTADGAPDPTFAGGGLATIGVNRYDYGRAVAVQPDGAVVVGGFSYPSSSARTVPILARFTPAGAPDPAFGIGGVVVTPGIGRTEDVLLQSDGRIVTVGRARRGPRYDMSVVRYRSDGSRDPSFSGDGMAFVNFGQEDSGVAGAIQPSKRLVIAGEVIPNDASFGSKFAAARLFLGAA